MARSCRPRPPSLVRAPNVAQRQLGFYLQDQLRWGPWTATVGLRHDKAKTETEGRPAAAADDSATTKRLGVTYQAGGGWAPYVSYTESFQPLGGVDFYGTPFKPQRGKQLEAGVKWIPEGKGLSGYAAVYGLREQNRKTNDPANPLNSLQLGEVKTQGFEAEPDRQPGQKLGLDTGLRLYRRQDQPQQRWRPGPA